MKQKVTKSHNEDSAVMKVAGCLWGYGAVFICNCTATPSPHPPPFPAAAVPHRLQMIVEVRQIRGETLTQVHMGNFAVSMLLRGNNNKNNIAGAFPVYRHHSCGF